MHLAIATLILIVAWKRGDWKNWRDYHTTMMYFALGNLLYNFLTANHFLWKLKADFLPNHSLTEMVYTFVTFPLTAFLFLSNYPKDRIGKQIAHNLKWILIFTAVEYFLMITGRIIYQYGWNLYWSIIFDCTMFPMLRLFYKRPVLAYGISAIMCVFWVWYFKVPVNVPIELRRP
ncbi:CBO0543 family protein [Paenibacillus cremeus]|uniref:Uncharacterized protein n=1 Tax=Paenibacillus cremeus TaxID=2163881 RepID=A0A559K5V5_9BACL|nr:CBO0543 family protein [Paenibacillus cremeus]TVY07514.1 hypothetical protein FPZ49_23820 [Paenibacillus cremeus]